MRRSICYCEPQSAKAGARSTWNFVHTTASTLPQNTLLRFDIQSTGRPIDWEPPSVDLQGDGYNVIYCTLESGQQLSATAIAVPDSVIPQYEFCLPEEVETGESFTITVGARKDQLHTPQSGNRCQTITQRRRQFFLYIDTSGKRRFQEAESFLMDIHGNEMENVRILAPSLVGRNKRFDVVARFEDSYGNLTSECEEDTLMELSYEQLRENLSWKIFVPETGFITLPNLYFNEPGVYTIELKNLTTGQTWKSSPILCSEDTKELLLWGLLHGESDKFDSTENIETCLRHFRDEKALNFYAISPFESVEETSNEDWKSTVQTTQDFNEDERFTTFIGFQWMGAAKKEGLRHILYLKDQKQLIRKKDAKGATLDKLYSAFGPKEILSIPSFTASSAYSYDFSNFSPEYERVVEIYNAWGSSELPAEEGNKLPITSDHAKKGIHENVEGTILKALRNNCRFGFVAGGLDDRGVYQNFKDQAQYAPGITAILAQEQTKQSLIEALSNRHCYATTGARIVIEFFLAGHIMGQEISLEDKPGLHVNRHITGIVAGTSPIASIELLRNAETIHTWTPDALHMHFTYDDLSPITDHLLPPGQGAYPFTFYHLRITQNDGHQAWSSPIWIDESPKMAKKMAKKK